MIFNDNNIKINYIDATYIIRKHSRDTSIDIHADNCFITFDLNDDFNPKDMNINEKIDLIKHINWDVSLTNNNITYVFDISKESISLIKLDEDIFKLEVKITKPDMICSYPEGNVFDSLVINEEFSFVYENIKCMLTSTMDLSEYDEEGNKYAKKFDNKNKKLDTIKKYIKKYDNFLFVASVEDNPEITDLYANIAIKSFEMTLPFKNYNILDGRTSDKAEELIKNADLIYICGGHVPTQNKFFNNINLRKLIRNTDAFIIGASAGSMNMAECVYAPPEYEEEVNDKYQRLYKGLGLTNINIFPHYDEIKDEILANKHIIKDLVLPDSYDRDIYVLNNGSYILIDDNEYIFGETYLFRDGIIKKICDDNKSTVNKSWRIK